MVTTGRRQSPPGDERLWRNQIDALIGAERIRELSVPSLSDTLRTLAVLWTEVIVLLAAANLLPRLPLGWAVAAGVVIVLLMGTRMNAFGVILHEGSHGLLARSRRLNDRLCNCGAAFWTVNSVEEYRPTHRLHHRYLGSEQDPDRSFYLVPARRGALTFLMLQDLIGVTAFRRATTRIAGTSQESGAPASLLARPQLLVGKLVTQLILLGQFVLFQGILRGVLFYVVFWLIPIVCLYPMILRLKTITEHFDAGTAGPDQCPVDGPHQRAGGCRTTSSVPGWSTTSNTTCCPPSPSGVCGSCTGQLDDSGLFVRDRAVLSGGYVRFLARAAAGKWPPS